jgi:hypothetical protein
MRSNVICTYCELLRWRIGWAWHITRRGENISTYKIFAGTPEGRRAIGRHMHRLEDVINMDLTKRIRRGVHWIQLAQNRDKWRVLVNTTIKLRTP